MAEVDFDNLDEFSNEDENYDSNNEFYEEESDLDDEEDVEQVEYDYEGEDSDDDKKVEDDDDEEESVDEEESDEEEEEQEPIIEVKIKRTLPYLTKYERSYVISTRSQQIANGSPIFIDIEKIPDIYSYANKYKKMNIIISTLIAKEELRQNKIPMVIRRKLPNGILEEWKLSELKDIGAR